MQIKDFKNYLNELNQSVLEAVEVASKIRSKQMRDSYEKGQQLIFPFDTPTWQAFWQNTYRMRNVTRKTGLPYATHPTKMALLLYRILGDSEQVHKAAQVALLHDYLEEGDGFSQQSFSKMKEEINLCPEACLGAVLLSEPVIDYDLFEAPLRIMQHVAYAKQILLNQKELQQFHFNAVIADKIDNGHDWAYITEDDNLTDHSKKKRLIVRLGYMKFIHYYLASFADPRLKEILTQTIDQQSARFEVSHEQLDIVVARLSELMERYAEPLTEQISHYHKRLKLWD